MKLGLGTAQFGLDYGVSNSVGKTTPDEVTTILELTASKGITLIDTASMYGSSEAVLGPTLSTMGHPFKIVTKTPRFGTPCLTVADVTHLNRVFYQSLSALQAPSVYGLLFHHADDLLADGASLLVEKVCEFKQRGLIKNWGFSAYTGQQIDEILNHFTPDLVQVPVNVLDQRLISGGQLSRLKQAGIEIHSRSAFLQGLLLMSPASRNPFFDQYSDLLDSFLSEARVNDLSPLQAALQFVMNIEEIDHVIVGVCSAVELEQISAAVASLRDKSVVYEQFASDDERLLNPAIWQLT